MNQEWTQTHLQRLVLDDYLAGGGGTPGPAVHSHFPDEDSLVRALHQRWVTLVDGCLETEMETTSGEPIDALRAAYATALGHAPALRRALDSYGGNRLLADLTEHHLVILANAVGSLRPGHTVREGIEEIRSTIAGIQARGPVEPTWRERHRRAREVRHLVTVSMRGY